MTVSERCIFRNSVVDSKDSVESGWIYASQFSKLSIELKYNWSTLPSSGHLIVEVVPRVQNNENKPIRSLYYNEFAKSGVIFQTEDITCYPEFKIRISNTTDQDTMITLTIYLIE